MMHISRYTYTYKILALPVLKGAGCILRGLGAGEGGGGRRPPTLGTFQINKIHRQFVNFGQPLFDVIFGGGFQTDFENGKELRTF